MLHRNNSLFMVWQESEKGIVVGRGEGEEYQDTEESVKQTYHHEDTPKLVIYILSFCCMPPLL